MQTAALRQASACSAAAKARTAESAAVQSPDAQSRAGRQRAEGGWPEPLVRVSDRPPVVALGKFDALHRGHRALAAEAAAMGGQPWLVSFSGMAEVLGMRPRAFLSTPCITHAAIAGRRYEHACAMPIFDRRLTIPHRCTHGIAAAYLAYVNDAKPSAMNSANTPCG